MLVDASQGRMFRRGSGTSGLVEVVSRAFAFDIEQVTTVAFAVWGEEQELALKYLNMAIDAMAEGDLSPARPVPPRKAIIRPPTKPSDGR